MPITKKQALAELELLYAHIPMPGSSVEDAVTRLRDYISNPTMQPEGWLYDFEHQKWLTR
jgi:hypothetical protein